MSMHLVTGATGYLGRALIQDLLERGDTVGIVVRGDETTAKKRALELFPDYSSKYQDRFVVFPGDVTLPDLGLSEFIPSLSRRGDLHFWHLAANLSFRGTDKEAVMKTNVDGTRNSVRFANRYASRFSYMSTAYVCGDAQGIFQEDELEAGQRFRNFYEQSKYLAEKVVREECRVPFVVFRPSIIVGRACEGKASTCTFGYYRFAFMFYFLKDRIARAVRSGSAPIRLALRAIGTRYDPSADVLYVPWIVLPYPQGGSVDLVHIEDVVRAMVGVHTQEIPSGTTLHLTQPTPLTFDFLLRSFLSDVGLKGVKHVGLPPPIFRLVFKGLYAILLPYRSYLRSMLKYLPYVSHEHRFSLRKTKVYPSLLCSPITRGRLRQLNRDAVKNVFTHIDGETYPGINLPTKPREDSVEQEPSPFSSVASTGAEHGRWQKN